MRQESHVADADGRAAGRLGCVASRTNMNDDCGPPAKGNAGLAPDSAGA